MSYKTRLVYFNSPECVTQLMQLATALAPAEDTRFIGLYVIPEPRFADSEVESETTKNSLDKEMNRQRDRAIRAREIFEAFEVPTDNALTWRTIEPKGKSVTDVVTETAQTVDLLVISQPDTRSSMSDERADIERIIINCGRPTLIVPAKGEWRTVGQHVLVAWNSTQAATRAVFNAVCLLEQAAKVTIFTMIAPSFERRQAKSTLLDLIDTLDRHGVNALPLEIPSTDTATSKRLLQLVESEGADLLIMGAYGHSRFREFFLKGTTRSIIRDMRTPILVSH